MTTRMTMIAEMKIHIYDDIHDDDDENEAYAGKLRGIRKRMTIMRKRRPQDDLVCRRQRK